MRRLGVPIDVTETILNHVSGSRSQIQRIYDRHDRLPEMRDALQLSGVGKSTLTNRLLGRAAQATQEVRAHDGRGRHTTTHRQLFTRLEGGAIIDSPGLRGLELWNPSEGSKSNFDDIEALAAQCRFRDCRHDSEPGCAVRAAVDRGGGLAAATSPRCWSRPSPRKRRQTRSSPTSRRARST